MTIKKRNKYVVTTEEKITMKGRTKPEAYEKYYTVYAYSAIQARKTVHGKIIRIEKTGIEK